MKPNIKLFFVFILTLFLVSCDSKLTNTFDTSQRTDNYLISAELKDKIDNLFIDNQYSNYVELNNYIVVEADVEGMYNLYKAYSCNISSTYSLQKNDLYFYTNFFDSEKNSAFELLTIEDSNLVKYNVENDIFKSREVIPTKDFTDNIYMFSEQDLYFFLENKDYVKLTDNMYKLSFKYTDLEQEPMYTEILESMFLDTLELDYNIDMSMKYVFSETKLDVYIEARYQPDDYENINIIYSKYHIQVSFEDSTDKFVYNPSDYYINAFEEVNDFMYVYNDSTNVQAHLKEGNVNVIKYHLTPGYYSFSTEHDRVKSYTITSETGGTIYPNNYFRIISEGDYYLHIDSGDELTDTIYIDKANLDNIQSVNDPHVHEGNRIFGLLNANESIHYMIDKDVQTPYILKVEYLYCDEQTTLYINNKEIDFIGQSNYYFVDKGDDYILSIRSDQDVDIDLEFSKLELDTSNSSNLEQMEILPNWPDGLNLRNTNFCFGPEDTEKYFKFTLTERDFVNFSVYFYLRTYHGEVVDSHGLKCELYSSNGTLISEWSYEGFLDPGTYYIRIEWYEGEYACGKIYLG